LTLQPRRRARRIAVVAVAGLLIAGGVAAIASTAMSAQATTAHAAVRATSTLAAGRGAALPYVSYEAETARYEGTLLGTDPLRTFGQTNFATESSGRESVRLDATGEFVEFTSTNPSNSIVVRNAIPDAPSGGGIDATISLYVIHEGVGPVKPLV
jgi:hypothetical protein